MNTKTNQFNSYVISKGHGKHAPGEAMSLCSVHAEAVEYRLGYIEPNYARLTLCKDDPATHCDTCERQKLAAETDEGRWFNY